MGRLSAARRTCPDAEAVTICAGCDCARHARPTNARVSATIAALTATTVCITTLVFSANLGIRIDVASGCCSYTFIVRRNRGVQAGELRLVQTEITERTDRGGNCPLGPGWLDSLSML